MTHLLIVFIQTYFTKLCKCIEIEVLEMKTVQSVQHSLPENLGVYKFSLKVPVNSLPM